MLAVTALLLALGAGAAQPAIDTGSVAPAGPTVASARTLAPDDTTPVRRRRKSVELPASYDLRLRVHRYTAYAIPVLFGVQYWAGQKLYDGTASNYDQMRNIHSVGAFAIGTAFTVNTVTGLWNLWDTRNQEEGRVLRYVHSLSILAADGIFAYAGATVGDDRTSGDLRRHRSLALTGMGISIASGAMMLLAR